MKRAIAMLALSVVLQSCSFAFPLQRATIVPDMHTQANTTSMSTSEHSVASILLEIAEGTEECSLPCWNGLTPGTSRSQEVGPFFQRLGITLGPDELPESSGEDGSVFRQPALDFEGSRLFNIGVVWEEDQVDLVGVMFAGSTEFLHPSKIADSHGYPAEIEIALVGTDTEYIYEYDIRFWYPAIGSRFRYSGLIDFQEKDEICFDETEGLFVTVDIFSQRYSEVGFHHIPDHVTEETMSSIGVSERDFLRLFNGDMGCLPLQIERLVR